MIGVVKASEVDKALFRLDEGLPITWTEHKQTPDYPVWGRCGHLNKAAHPWTYRTRWEGVIYTCSIGSSTSGGRIILSPTTPLMVEDFLEDWEPLYVRLKEILSRLPEVVTELLL